MRLDPLDSEILKLLAADARLSFRELAGRLGSTTPTVAARVRALEDIGLIQGYHARLDPGAVGGRPYVLVVSCRPGAANATAADVARLEGVAEVHLLAGARLMVHALLRPPHDLAALHEALSACAGVDGYGATEVIATHRPAVPVPLPTTVDVPCHQCRGPIHAEPVRTRLGGRVHVFCCKGCAGAFGARFEAAQAAAGPAIVGSAPIEAHPGPSPS